MKLSTRVLDGCWRIYVAAGYPEIHPAILGMLRREGYASNANPPRLTPKGRDVIDGLIHAHQTTGYPLPDNFKGDLDV